MLCSSEAETREDAVPRCEEKVEAKSLFGARSVEIFAGWEIRDVGHKTQKHSGSISGAVNVRPLQRREAKTFTNTACKHIPRKVLSHGSIDRGRPKTR